MGFDNQQFTDFKDNLKEADRKLDNNIDSNSDGVIDDNEINDSESQLEYSKAVKKLEDQYTNIDYFLSTVEKGSENEKNLKLLKNNLNNFIININNEITGNGTKLFSEIANDLNSHWNGVFSGENKDIILENELNKFNFINIQKGDTLSEIIQDNYKINDWHQIESIIIQLYIQNPDKIKIGDGVVLPKINLLKKEFNNKGNITFKELIEGIKQEFNSQNINIQNINLEDNTYGNVVTIDNEGKMHIDIDTIQKIENIEKATYAIEIAYENIIKSGDEYIFEKNGIGKSKEERLSFLTNTILGKNQRYKSISQILDLFFANEKNEFNNTEKDYIDFKNESTDISDNNLINLWKSFKQNTKDTYKDLFNIPGIEEKYRRLFIKQRIIKSIINNIKKGLENNFGQEKNVSEEVIKNYINKNLNGLIKGKFGGIYNEIMSENNFIPIISSLTNPNLSTDEIKNLTYDFANIMSNQMRSWSSFAKDTINTIPKEQFNKILPNELKIENIDKLKIEYEKLKIKIKNHEIENFPETSTLEEYREYKIKKYLENIETNEIKDKTKINEFVENNILSKKIDLLGSEQNNCLNKISQKEKKLLNEYKKDGIKRLNQILEKYGINNSYQIEDIFNKNLENIFISYIGNDSIQSSINTKFVRTEDIYMKIQKGGDYGILGNSTLNLIDKIEYGLKYYNNKIDSKIINIQEDSIDPTKKYIVTKILEDTYIKGSIGAISNFKTNYENQNPNIVKENLINKLFPNTTNYNSEKNLFKTYSNINDSFNETLVFSDDSTEFMINGIVFLATSFGSAGLGTLIKSSKMMSTLLEASSFSSANLSYKNKVKGKLEHSDYLYTAMMSLNIAIASNIISKSNFSLKDKILGKNSTSETNVKLRLSGKTAEGASTTIAYGEDYTKILAHFAKVKGFKQSKFGFINSLTTGNLTPKNS